MNEPAEVLRTFSVENARLACGILSAHGIEARYEDPSFAGNFMLSWNLPVTEHIVQVEESAAEEASRILEANLPMEDDGPAGVEEAADVETTDEAGDAVEPAPIDSEAEREMKGALNAAILTWVFLPMALVAGWRLWRGRSYRLEGLALSRFNRALVVLSLGILAWLFVYASIVMPFRIYSY